MSPNKNTVEKYMEAFRRLDHAAVLSCLTDDVEWLIPGMFLTLQARSPRVRHPRRTRARACCLDRPPADELEGRA
jgi:ketosteroid isomerase-like protein